MEDPLTTQLRTSEMTAASRPSAAGVAHLFQPLEPVVAEPLKTSNTFAMVKSALGLSSLIIAITSLGVLITVFTTKRKGMVSVGLNLQLSLAGASIIWHLAESATLACRRDWRSIYQGAHMGVHLILWILAVLAVSFHSLGLSYMLGHYDIWKNCTHQGIYFCDFVYGYYEDWDIFQSQGVANWYFGIMEALTGLSVTLLVLHFTLFVMSCIEMNRRRVHEKRKEKKRKIIYLVAAPGMADGRMYYTPLEQLSQRDRRSVPAPRLSHHHDHGSSA